MAMPLVHWCTEAGEKQSILRVISMKKAVCNAVYFEVVFEGMECAKST